MVSPYDSYSRVKSAGAQFKQMQNEKPEFLQNFCFDPGGSRDKIDREKLSDRIYRIVQDLFFFRKALMKNM